MVQLEEFKGSALAEGGLVDTVKESACEAVACWDRQIIVKSIAIKRLGLQLLTGIDLNTTD